MIYELLTLLLLPILNTIRPKKNLCPNRILLIQSAKIGDFINTSSALLSLRHRYPDACLSVLISSVNKPLASCNDNINEIYIYRDRGYHGTLGRFELAKLIYSTQSDLVISFNYSSVISVSAALALTKNRISVVRATKSLSRFIVSLLWDETIIHKPERLIHQTYNDLLQHCGASQNDRTFRNRVCYSNSQQKYIDEIFRNDDVQYIGIGISSANKLKEISTNKIIDLIRILDRAAKIKIILIGASSDKDKAIKILNGTQDVTDTTGEYFLSSIPYLMKKIHLFIGVDSGLTYIADAVKTPVISISGPCNMSETKPLGSNSAIIQNLSLSCMPCSYIHNTAKACRLGTVECIETISTIDIIDKSLEILAKLKHSNDP